MSSGCARAPHGCHAQCTRTSIGHGTMCEDDDATITNAITHQTTASPPPPQVGSDRSTQACVHRCKQPKRHLYDAELDGVRSLWPSSSIISTATTSNFSCNRTKTAFKVSSGDGVKTRMLSSRSSVGNNQHGGMWGARIRRIHTSTRLRPERRMGTKD